MRSVIQRVKEAQVSVNNIRQGAIGAGLLVYIGAAKGDRDEDAAYTAEKIAYMRLFEDGQGKMNRSVLDIGGSVLAVSQFTLLGDARKGRRPSYGGAEEPERAKFLYEYVIRRLKGLGLPCEQGVFQAAMDVQSVNWGPVTIILDSRLH
jgi:D-tyrosyl-tRNA(Tyr) deacylase